MTLYSSNSWENYWMSFLQLVTLDDKTQWRDNSILENTSIWPISQHLPFFEECNVCRNVCNCPTGTWWSFCGNQSNCRNCRICRICILIGECWNGVDSLEILEHCRIAWKGWKVMNDWIIWKDWKDWNVWNVL